MAAESDDATTRSVPEWLIPPPDGFTADEFLQMRGLPRHTELIDGSLVFVSPQRKWHGRVILLLVNELDEQAPDGMRADHQMSVKLGERQCPEPDVLVVSEESLNRAERDTHYLADEVVLAVEVVSPESKERDRETKPLKYAAAGIRHFWRVEEDESQRHAVVYVHQLDLATRAYALTGIFHERLKISVPFDIDIDLTSAWERRRRP
ncbi:Uma2 family endonuclease [Actinomadura adrarensis]|uniref:Uma2 family endonuclease n=1 Tax=Actinomadura adrarensis TaxID=1819600 RepID=A0ABW3CT87_9ACTN